MYMLTSTCTCVHRYLCSYLSVHVLPLLLQPEDDDDTNQPKKKRARVPGGTVNPMAQWAATSHWETEVAEWAIAYHNANYRPKIDKADKNWTEKVHHLAHTPSLMRRSRQFVGLAFGKGYDNNTQLGHHLRECVDCSVLPESVKDEFCKHLSNNYQIINSEHLLHFVNSITKKDVPVVIMNFLPVLQALGFLLYHEHAFMTPVKFYDHIQQSSKQKLF